MDSIMLYQYLKLIKAYKDEQINKLLREKQHNGHETRSQDKLCLQGTR